jgi:hypothetical protein
MSTPWINKVTLPYLTLLLFGINSITVNFRLIRDITLQTNIDNYDWQGRIQTDANDANASVKIEKSCCLK